MFWNTEAHAVINVKMRARPMILQVHSASDINALNRGIKPYIY